MSLDWVFDASYTLVKYRSGPLGRILDDFCDWLAGQGYSRHTIRLILSHVDHLNRFLEVKNKGSCDRLSENHINAFFKAYPRKARNRGPLETHVKRVRWSIQRFVKYLQKLGRYDSKTVRPAFASILEGYLQWMYEYRHVSKGTLAVRRHSLSVFLSSLGSKATYRGLKKLTPEAVESFCLSYAKTMGCSAQRSMQSALRTFFRFCLQKKHIKRPLDKAVPSLHVYKLATVPRGLSYEQAQKVLRCVDRQTPVGRRDYAMLQLLYTYGVRGGQVRALQLADIDWQKNRVMFRALKHGKASLLPLTEDVGESLLDYLKKGRPKSDCTEVFLTSRAPHHGLKRSGTLSAVVCRYIVKAKINIPSKGAHTLRHGFATRMVRAGHPLKSIADILGHRHLSTTFIYTKVDFESLRQVALPWPQEVLP